ncbi:hypothetical protein [Streptomyces sp. NPDC048603]|uniref:hypothetical protein n=1 Tax=Streptomyces sp. NPDC048603 TaxID=3365577 RepID=UPI00371F752A
MRVMIRGHVDTVAGNEAIKGGKLPGLMDDLIEKLKPEAAYFGPSEGVRSFWIVCDLTDSSALPALLEPLFFDLHAEVEVQPVMNHEDMKKGMAATQHARKG